MAPPAALLEHVRELQAQLDGKNTRRLKEPARGTALLVLTDDAGETHRVRIELGAEHAAVSFAGAGRTAELSVIRAHVNDWLAFYNAAGPETLSALKFYGDPALMAALGELFLAQRSMVDLRSRGGR